MDTTILERPQWLDDFEKSNGRRLRVLHVGNIANNAYINAKIMRKVGIDADVVCADYYHIMGTPEWEEADFKGNYGDDFFPDWWRALRGYSRPKWFFQGPKRLCHEAIRAQFETPQEAEEKLETLTLATNFIAFRDSKIESQNGAKWSVRYKRRFDFLVYLVSFTMRRPRLAFKSVKRWPFRLSKTGRRISLAFKLSVVALTVIVWLPLMLISKMAASQSTSQNHWILVKLEKLRVAFSRHYLWPVLLFGRRIFRSLTGKSFSDVTGRSLSNLVFKKRLVQSDVQIAQKASVPDPHFESERNSSKGKDISDADREKFFSEARKYLKLLSKRHKWSALHKAYHQNISDAEFRYDMDLASSLTGGWDDVYQHYDVVQCYSTDGIVPMALGRKNFFNYEHGTLRAIPFQDSPIGRLTASAYRACTKVMLTNLDNIASCDRLGIPKNKVVALPHAMDDAKIHRFVSSHPNVQPTQHNAPLFFSSARQHWLDKDPNYAKGNDIFFHALSRVRQNGGSMRVILVEWGRDLEATKDLLSDLHIADIVSWVPTMTGEELWKRYLQCHAVVDQFVIPAFGRVTFDSLTIGRRVISNLDITLAEEFFGEAPPMLVCATIDDAERAVQSVILDPEDKAGVGIASSNWARKYHSSQRILNLQLEAYAPTLGISN